MDLKTSEKYCFCSCFLLLFTIYLFSAAAPCHLTHIINLFKTRSSLPNFLYIALCLICVPHEISHLYLYFIFLSSVWNCIIVSHCRLSLKRKLAFFRVVVFFLGFPKEFSFLYSWSGIFDDKWSCFIDLQCKFYVRLARNIAPLQYYKFYLL